MAQPPETIKLTVNRPSILGNPISDKGNHRQASAGTGNCQTVNSDRSRHHIETEFSSIDDPSKRMQLQALSIRLYELEAIDGAQARRMLHVQLRLSNIELRSKAATIIQNLGRRYICMCHFKRYVKGIEALTVLQSLHRSKWVVLQAARKLLANSVTQAPVVELVSFYFYCSRSRAAFDSSY